MLLLTPIVAPILAGCNGYGSGTAATVDGGVCNGVGGDSTVDDQHAHAICVPTADLTAPPANGQTYTSSTSAGHTHTITLTNAQLMTIASGQPVPVTSSSAIDPVNNDAHTHSWTLRKVAG